MKSDAQIQTDVLEQLKWEPSVTHANIGVAVSDGVVTLSGYVPCFYEKSTAEKTAESVSGVKAVVDKIEVKLPGAFTRNDEDIAKAAVNAVKWDARLPDDLKITVEKGVVTLKGEVEWEYQREAATNLVQTLNGVKAVCNEMTIKRKIKPDNIRKIIQDALLRAAEREAKDIKVDVKGHTVVLSGRVRSLSELSTVRGIVWAAPGVATVESHLTVGG